MFRDRSQIKERDVGGVPDDIPFFFFKKKKWIKKGRRKEVN
jgi:hypothetical protein